jgi:hypothetical protein
MPAGTGGCPTRRHAERNSARDCVHPTPRRSRNLPTRIVGDRDRSLFSERAHEVDARPTLHAERPTATPVEVCRSPAEFTRRRRHLQRIIKHHAHDAVAPHGFAAQVLSAVVVLFSTQLWMPTRCVAQSNERAGRAWARRSYAASTPKGDGGRAAAQLPFHFLLGVFKACATRR